MKEAAAGAKAGPAVSKAPDKEGEATGEDEENKVSAAEPGAVGRWYAHWREQGLGAWWEATLAAWAGDREAWEFPVLPAPVPRSSVALLYASGPITQGKASGAGGMQVRTTTCIRRPPPPPHIHHRHHLQCNAIFSVAIVG